jgi:3-phosphoshikimate 1-carboxyvinyltransferase
MQYLALPRAREVRGRVDAPASKSATNRALLLAALSPEPVEVVSPLASDDTEALLACLRAMGARIAATPRGLSLSGPLGAGASVVPLDARDSGTAARLLAAAAAASPGRFRLDGSARLRERPMAELVAALREVGAGVRGLGEEGFLPLEIAGGGFRSASLSVDASRSSQFLSALLLAAVAVEGGLTIRPAGTVVSEPYVGMTIEVLEAFGHEVRREAGAIAVVRGARTPSSYTVPGDYSSALPLLAAAGAAGGRVTVSGLEWPSLAADAGAVPVLERMGLTIESSREGVTASFAGGGLSPVSIDANDFPDAVPVLAALAALASGESRFTGTAHLRWKESERASSVEALVRAAGGRARAASDALAVSGGLAPDGLAFLPTFDDHRIAMAAALLAIARGRGLVENPGCVSKSYPAFFHDLASLIR